MTTRSNTVGRPIPLVLLAQPVCGYAADKTQRDALIAWGLNPANVWTLGDGSENLDEAIYKQRDRCGTIIIAGISRVLGDTKVAVIEAARKIELAGVKVIDTAASELATLSDHINRALAFVAGAARMKSNRRARYIGGKGGTAKGAGAAARRNALFDDDLMRKLVAYFGAGSVGKALGAPFAASTLRRHYS